MTRIAEVLNLIVAVVVDTFAEARERDVLNLAEALGWAFGKRRQGRLAASGNGDRHRDGQEISSEPWEGFMDVTFVVQFEVSGLLFRR